MPIRLTCTLPYCGQEIVCKDPDEAELYYVESDDGMLGETRCLLHLNVPITCEMTHSAAWLELFGDDEGTESL